MAGTDCTYDVVEKDSTSKDDNEMNDTGSDASDVVH